MDEKMAKTLELIGKVRMEKVPAHNPEGRLNRIDQALQVLQENQDRLSEWENNFYHDIRFRYTMAQDITVKQEIKLLEIRRKYL